ncbi:tetratricopeptide repeat protein [uncultured Pseudodesulfovibrio sp.]|uniref:tetratricopeptide repeat protein n=1 Tax=uncultured Pseudodesulfovibrio sp. TaxID=2035858 RepID=UPI0029C7ECE7|nr:tetratricopeptide repeat protein [uncultured Pseudodesulfovibrio sp.]
MKSAKISLWSLGLALVAGLLIAAPAQALRVTFNSKGDSDRLTFSFDSEKLPKTSVTRTGKQDVVVTLPDTIWDSEAKPSPKDFPGKLVKSIRTTGNSIQIVTRTSGFGYIKVPTTTGKAQFVLQLFRDPYGSRWKPRKPQAKPAPAIPAKLAQKPASTVTPKPQAKPQPVAAPVQQKPVSQPEPVVQPVQPISSPMQGEANLPPEGNVTGERKPFFSVPYSVRNEVAPPGQPPSAVSDQSEAQAVQPVAQRDVSGDYPASSELRFKAVNKMAEEVKFAELAGEGAGGTPVVGQVAQPLAPVVDEGAAQEAQPVELPAGAAGGTVVPPASVPAQVQPVTQPSGDVAGTVSSEQSVALAPIVTTEEVSGEGQVGGSVVPPPPTVIQGSPPPEPTAEESAQVVQSVVEEPVQEVAPPAEPPAQEAEQPVVAETDVPAGEAPVTEPGMDNATAEAAAQEQAVRDQLSEAQSMMFSGNLPEALRLFEGILKMPNVPEDVREETLYAVADIKKQLNSEDLAASFEEISQAFIEAMNANLRSNRVPRALLNLGLLNLQVGNFPEAKAYFKILQEKYPDDDNIPSISYYWGEYYYKKGDYKKAADQFQYLIQTYPEHQLVKQAAFYLADALNRTGFIEQAFQIIDYIDKRWPDYYMENPEFLRLAGGVEMQLRKWPQAKNHYFTYYNLNPEAEGSDVVLARIGDIYIYENQKKAARQIYEKAVLNYPDKEGGLIAKMRLAEEGIYDNPSMPQMGNIFNRPYNKRPENIYKEIIEEHPDSPLAPIAQLKLAMWYAFNKKYPEALSAAQDLLEKYPDSPLVDRARKLGDSVFALAVPGMVGEERYGRVVRYWETYDFIGKEDTKVDEWTRLNIATSYWKIGQPEKALELLKPFLAKKQVKDVSDKALGLAVNIYLDQLAWKEISDLIAMAKTNWTLKPEQLRQLDYARAMSLQNLGNSNQALPMWAELAKDVKVEPAFRAYAMYYMAKAAMERQDLRKVFVYAQEALSLLLQTNGDPEKIKDAVLMSIYATERSGRYNEALKWAREYDRYIDVDNPEWASTRFKLARIYRKAGAIGEWKQLLGDIIEKKPDSLQAQLAKSALDTYDLEQQAEQYAPAPQ